MNFRSGLLTGIVGTVLTGGVATAAWWIATAPKPVHKQEKPPPAATVDKKIKEDELNVVTDKPKAPNVITTTPKAEGALQVETALVERKRVARARAYGGDVVVPAGKTVLVSAPLTGKLVAPKDGMPLPGRIVKAGQPMFQLLPLLTPDVRANMEDLLFNINGQMETAQIQVSGAKILLDRNKELRRKEAGSQRMVDEAQVAYDAAVKQEQVLKARLDSLRKTIGEFEKGTAAPMTIDAPEEGLLRNVSAQPGQNVPSGAALFEIIDLTKVWVRVPVYVGDIADVAKGEPVAVGHLVGRPGESNRSAQPIEAPPTANPLANTVDLYYELENPPGDLVRALLPGQKVGVTIPLLSKEESLIVPWPAVIHDLYGGTWVYEKLGENRYARRRVEVRYVIPDEFAPQNGSTHKRELAVLASGPAVKTPVVIKGAAELWGIETGFSK